MFIIVLVVFSTLGYSQTTWYVPGDFHDRMQAAISDPLVVNGDTIEVQCGYYVENIDFHLSAISPFIDAGDNFAPSLPLKDFDEDPRIFAGN